MKLLATTGELPNIDNLFKYVKEIPIIDVLNDVKNKVERDISTKAVKGWVVTAFYSAIYCIYHIKDINEAFKYIINKKGDTDNR